MKTEKLNFNDWMDHIANQLQSDYRKLYYSSKYQNDANIRTIPRSQPKYLRRVQTLRLFADQ